MDKQRYVVLAVDDETIILWGTASLLESLGYVVLRANSGKVALEALTDRPEIDVLLTDFQMPSMSGVELADAARDLRPDLPVIIATGHTNFRHGQGCPWVILEKPFARADLDDAVKVALKIGQ